MRKTFGFLFVLTLVLIPISFKVKAENPVPTLNVSGADSSTSSLATSTDATSTDATSIVATTTPNVSTSTNSVSASNNPIIILRNLIMKRLELGAQSNNADISTIRNGFSFFQKRFEEILRRLNNTD